MRVSSLGYKTDLIFPAFDAELIDRQTYLVIRTPANPGFYWGNFLLFPGPPGHDDLARWCRLFDAEIGTPLKTQHQAFGWDSSDGDAGMAQDFLDAGFGLVRSAVMTSRAPESPARMSDEVEVRVLSSEFDWQQALENQMICRDPEFEEVAYRVFRERQIHRYRQMVRATRGDWYGAFLGERLVADAGVFHDGVLGRFQLVGTHPDHRRRGIAAALVVTAARHALRKYDLREVVIVAEEASPAQRLYDSVGFQAAEIQVGLARWPKAEVSIGGAS